MNRLRRSAAVVALLLTAAAFPLAGQAASRSDEPISAELALATFDSAWSRIRNTYYDTTMRGVDWDVVRDTLRPRAATAGTLGELRRTLNAMLGTLGESHFGIIPQEAADALDPERPRTAAGTPGDVGVTLRLVGDTVMVTAVRAGSSAERAGVRPGWTVDSVGRFSASRARRTIAGGSLTRQQQVQLIPAGASAQFAGPEGSSITAHFRDHAGKAVELELVRGEMSGMPVRFGNLPTMFVDVDQVARSLGGGRCVGIIRFSAWMLPAMARLDSAVHAVRSCDGVVIDLRGNPGGVGAMVMGFGGHFLDTAATLGEMRTRGTTLRFVANPRRADVAGQPVRPFAGPVAIVVDSLSMSTSEIFAAGMKSIGRARLFGENTPGLALPAVLIRLPTGDVMMHVFADFTDPDGRRIEGAGAQVDEAVPLRREDLIAGRDAPLTAAIQWIAGTPQPVLPVRKDVP